MNKKHTYNIGDIYNILKLIELFRNEKNGLMAIVECTKCNKQKTVRARDLYNSKTNSCMCQNIKHNMHKTRIYRIYSHMKDRCFNERNDAYKNYGRKGIVVCDEWVNDDGFSNFYNWSINNGYSESLTIDRIDSNGNYEPKNCQWISLGENVAKANKHNHRRKANNGRYYGISPDGTRYEFDNANSFAEEFKLNPGCVRQVANDHKKNHNGWKFGFINKN